jgi:hypothetical protein
LSIIRAYHFEQDRRAIMTYKIMQVNLVGIDAEGVQEDRHFSGLASVPFKLSFPPNGEWVKFFRNEYKAAVGHSKKGQLVEVTHHGEIILKIGMADDPQVHFDFLEQVIEATNKEVNRINPKLLADEERKTREEVQRKARLAKLKEKAAKVKPKTKK